MRAMILAAGLGTRLKPLTDSIPKALIKVREFTLLELQIIKLQKNGFNEIIINVHHLADLIKKYLEQNNLFNCSITISDESEKLLETGGGLKKALNFFSDGKPFLVHNVDVLSDIDLKSLMEFHLSSKSIATLAVQNRNSSRKFLFNRENILCGWMNEKTGKKITVRENEDTLIPYAFSGIQIIHPKIFKYFPKWDVFSLVDLYLAAAKNERISAYIHNDDTWIDLGTAKNLHAASEVLDKLLNQWK